MAETCTLDGCARKAWGGAICPTHKKRMRVHGTFAAPVRTACTFKGCGRKHMAKGLCGPHYYQKQRGSELSPIRALRRPLEEVFWERVIIQDGCWGWANPPARGYPSVGSRKTRTLAHRLSWTIHHGAIPAGMEVDHQCRNPNCTNPGHLKVVTHRQNLENRGPNTGSRSGFRGVSWMPAKGKWRARVTANGVDYHLGLFDTAEEADSVASAKRIEVFSNSVDDRRRHAQLDQDADEAAART